MFLCLVFFSPTIERPNLSSLFYMKQSLMVCWYKYRTDRDSVFRSSGPHWKFNHCLCNTEALYFLNPREFISYYAFLCFSPHIHSPLCRGCELLFVLLSHKLSLSIFPPTVEEAQYLWKHICFSLPSPACHLHVTAVGFHTCFSSLLSTYQIIQFPVILFHCCLRSFSLWAH